MMPSRHDPFRSPNWRWERARWLREHGKNTRQGVDDDWTKLAKRYQVEEIKATTDMARARLEMKYEGLHHAYNIYKRKEKDVRWAIEARLLAREPLDRIANRSNTTPEVIQSYEAIFFNVLDSINKPDYIVNVVMGASVHHGLADRDYDLLWKLYGYAGGYHVLDALITPFNNAIKPVGHDAVEAFFSDDARSTIRRKSAIAARTLPIAYNQQIILETHTRLLEIEKNASDMGEAKTQILQNINAVVTGLPFRPGTLPRLESPRLNEYDNHGAELRADEMIAVALGAESDKHRKVLTLSYPETQDGQS